MSEFAKRTGLSPAAQNPRRYLWTDAFAVCNFLELFQQTADQQYQLSGLPGPRLSRHAFPKSDERIHGFRAYSWGTILFANHALYGRPGRLGS